MFMVSGGVTLLLRIANMVPMQKVVWDKLPSWVKYTVVFMLSTAGSFLGSMHTGTPWTTALMTAISAALTSSGFHEMTIKAGETHAAMSVKKDPDYQPGMLRKMFGIVVPIDDSMIKPKI
jgi:hypothetical protein